MQWYRSAARDLPWRQTRDPYRIWVSEVMLQQTRVAAVIPYYYRFLERFPDVETLAAAGDQELLAAWAGLGYYSRVRNMRKAAQEIVAGKWLIEKAEAAVAGAGCDPWPMAGPCRFPDNYDAIRALPGIGDYTAAAVASIAFGLPYAVLDGNVARVISRLTADPSDIGSPFTRKKFQAKAQELLDSDSPGTFNQAVMELGATVCLPQEPMCLVCPVARHCEARRLGKQAEFPVKLRRQEIVAEERVFVWVVAGRNEANPSLQNEANGSGPGAAASTPDANGVPEERSCDTGRVAIRNEPNLDLTFFPDNSLPPRSKSKPGHRRQPLAALADALGPDTRILMRQYPADARRLAGFWELPELRHLPGAKPGRPVGEFQHAITRHRYRCTVVESNAPGAVQDGDGLRWVTLRDLGSLPLTAAATKSLFCLSDFHHGSSIFS